MRALERVRDKIRELLETEGRQARHPRAKHPPSVVALTRIQGWGRAAKLRSELE
jgi:hypothetical protein